MRRILKNVIIFLFMVTPSGIAALHQYEIEKSLLQEVKRKMEIRVATENMGRRRKLDWDF